MSGTRPDATGTATDAWRSDLAGNRIWFRHDNGRRVRSEWSQMGRLTAVSVDLSVEPATPIWLPIASYGRSGFGEAIRESTWALGDTGQRLWGRDLTGRVVTYDQSVRQGDGTWSATDTSLGWRPDGRLASDTTVGQAGWVYDYDPAGQLVEADPDSGASLSWGYGIAGQRTSATTAAGTTTSTWDVGAMLLTGTDGPAGTVSFGYDSAGRRTSRTLTPPAGVAQTTTSTYDDRGRLATTTTGATTASRGYDIDGRLTTSTSGGLTYTATWDPTTPVPEMVELEVLGQHVNYGMGESRLWTDQNGAVAWNAFDVHGSAIDTPDTTAPTGYDPYGNPTPALTGGFGYRDELTIDGLAHLRNRDYDPATGTFTTPDPLDSIDGTPTAGNPHHYTDNDPLNKTDPWGLRPTDTAVNNSDTAEPWLLERAWKAFEDLAVDPQVTGQCGSLAADTWLASEIDGCVIDDGNKLGLFVFTASGVGGGVGGQWPAATGVSVGVLTSNADSIEHLSGWSVCVALGVVLPIDVFGGPALGGGVCFGMYASVTADEFDSSSFAALFDGTVSLQASFGVSAGALVSGRVVYGIGAVREFWNYPAWVDQWCGGRVISNPFNLSLGGGICEPR